MESFFRYISYMDYYRNEGRIRNVGFLRWKLHNGEHRIEMQLKDVTCPQGKYEIKEKNTGKILGEILIDKGIGSFIKNFPSKSASGETYIDTLNDRLYLSDVEGFLITLSSNEYLSVEASLEFVKKKNNGIQRKSIELEKLVYEEKIGCDERIEEQDTKAASENVLIEGIEEKYIEPIYVENEKKTEYIETKENVKIEKEIEPTTDTGIKIIEPLHEDKWQQLCKKYPNVHPFPDKNTFLAIKPEDFIVLQKEYQKLVQNSFLLHGFYNYGHMILGKLSEEENTPVYVGVPGVYYEREKQAAQMFGFVGFESAEHPVQAGSYGYYMIEVEL